MTRVTITEMERGDWPSVKRIYNEGIETGIATFESKAPGWEIWDAHHLPNCRLIAKIGNEIVGWAALTAYSHRRVYSGVAEASLYIGRDHRGQGIGSQLMEALIQCSEENFFWTLQADIIAENSLSRTLLENHGFRLVGVRERIARREGIWHDTLVFERRSTEIGAEAT